MTFSIPKGGWTAKSTSRAGFRDTFIRKVGAFQGISAPNWQSIDLGGEKVKKYNDGARIFLKGGDNLKDAALAYIKARGFKRDGAVYVDKFDNCIKILNGSSSSPIWVEFI